MRLAVSRIMHAVISLIPKEKFLKLNKLPPLKTFSKEVECDINTKHNTQEDK